MFSVGIHPIGLYRHREALRFQLPQTNLVEEEQVSDGILQTLRAGLEHGDQVFLLFVFFKTGLSVFLKETLNKAPYTAAEG